MPSRNTAIPAATNSAPASTRSSAARQPVRAPAPAHRRRCDSSASRHTTAAPTTATPSGPTTQPSAELPSAAAASPTPEPERGQPERLLALARRHRALDVACLLPDEDPQQPVGDDTGTADGHQRDERGAHPQHVRRRGGRPRPPATPATSRPDRRRCSGRAGGRRRGCRSGRHGGGHAPIVTRTRGRAIGVAAPISQGRPLMSGAPGPSNLGAMNGSDVHSTLREMWETRPARPREGRQIAGVAAAIARRYDIDPVLVRVGFVVAAFYGIGAALYIAGWVLLPDEPGPAITRPAESQGLAAGPDRRSRPWPASAGRRTPTAGSCCRSWPSPRCCSCCTAAAAPGASPGHGAGR